MLTFFLLATCFKRPLSKLSQLWSLFLFWCIYPEAPNQLHVLDLDSPASLWHDHELPVFLPDPNLPPWWLELLTDASLRGIPTVLSRGAYPGPDRISSVFSKDRTKRCHRFSLPTTQAVLQEASESTASDSMILKPFIF